MDIPEQTLMNELNKLLRQKLRKKTRATREEIPDEKIITEIPKTEFDPLDISFQEKAIIRLLLLYGDRFFKDIVDGQEEPVNFNIASYVVNDLIRDGIEIKDPVLGKIFEEYKNTVNEGKVPNLNYLTGHPDEAISKMVIELISSPYDLSQNWEKNKIYVKTEEDQLKTLTKTTVLALKEKYIRKQIKEKKQMLKEEKDFEKIEKLIEKLKFLERIRNEINKILKRQILP